MKEQTWRRPPTTSRAELLDGDINFRRLLDDLERMLQNFETLRGYLLRQRMAERGSRLNSVHFDLLTAIADKGSSVLVVDLAELLRLPRTEVRNALRDLGYMHLLRSSGVYGSNAKLWSLTDEGKNVLAQLVHDLQEINDKCFEGISQETFQELCRVADRARQVSDRMVDRNKAKSPQG